MRARLLGSALGVALVAVMATACTSEQPTSVSTPTPAPATPVPLTQPYSPDGATAGLDLIRDAIDGPLIVRSVVLYETYMFAEVRDPQAPENLDEYSVRDGAVSGPEPIQLRGTDKNLADVWAAEAVDWNAIAAIAADPAPVMGFEGRTTHVYVEMTGPDRAITARGFFDGPRRSGYWSASASGQILETSID